MQEDEAQREYGEDEGAEIEVEAPETAEMEEGASAQTAAGETADDEDDQFQKAETATQKRIDRLTKKMREAERQREEALRYAQAIQTEADKMKQRMEALDTNYVSEFNTRVTTQMQQAENELSRAMELGDTKAAVEAQRKLTALAIQADRAEQAKQQQEYMRKQAESRQAAPVQQQQAPKRPDPKAEQWAARNPWFGQDDAMTYAAFGIHKTLVETEGFDPTTDDYYSELDRRISEKFGRRQEGTGNRPAQTVAGASRQKAGRSGKKVRLTPSQVAIAKKLGVPLEEYAKYVKE